VIADEIAALKQLEAAGQTDAYLAGAIALAARHPDDVAARLCAAYASDRWGTEEAAIVHYDAAFALGVPADVERGFFVGYGSTLRNVGRTADAIACLRAAIAKYPTYVPLRAFLALALYSAGEHAAAMATMLDALLVGAPGDYDRALAYYRDELSASARG
jgi:tetratricopeptide (TPR) repeat protein